MKTKQQKISFETKTLLEFYLNQEMQHIANQFDEFTNLTFATQVIFGD